MFTRGGWVLLVGATYVSQPDGQTTIQLLVGAGGRAGHWDGLFRFWTASKQIMLEKVATIELNLYTTYLQYYSENHKLLRNSELIF